MTPESDRMHAPAPRDHRHGHRLLIAALGCGVALATPVLLLREGGPDLDLRYHLSLIAVVGGSLVACVAARIRRDQR